MVSVPESLEGAGRGMLVLVPTLNEVANIENALRRITARLPSAAILVIDDDSSDGTWQRAEASRARWSQVSVMVRRGKTPGLGRSIRDGYQYACDKKFDTICIVDCDLQQDPADVIRMFDADPRADIVIGSRYLSRGSFVADYDAISKWLSVVSNNVIRWSFLFPWRDVTTDFFIVRTNVFEKVPPSSLICNGYALFFELKVRARRAGYRFAEIAVPTFSQRERESRRTWRQVYRFGLEFVVVWFALTFARTKAT